MKYYTFPHIGHSLFLLLKFFFVVFKIYTMLHHFAWSSFLGDGVSAGKLIGLWVVGVGLVGQGGPGTLGGRTRFHQLSQSSCTCISPKRSQGSVWDTLKVLLW